MPQSLSRALIHLIFSTKNRICALNPPLQAELFPYLAGVLNNTGCPSLQTGGSVDHVHLLFALSRTRTIAQMVEKLKTSSSHWIKARGPIFREFRWQAGYGAFSVSESCADRVIEYIRNQGRHHHTLSFQDEFRLLLERYHVAYDENCVWD